MQIFLFSCLSEHHMICLSTAHTLHISVYGDCLNVCLLHQPVISLRAWTLSCSYLCCSNVFCVNRMNTSMIFLLLHLSINLAFPHSQILLTALWTVFLLNISNFLSHTLSCYLGWVRFNWATFIELLICTNLIPFTSAYLISNNFKTMCKIYNYPYFIQKEIEK